MEAATDRTVLIAGTDYRTMSMGDYFSAVYTAIEERAKSNLSAQSATALEAIEEAKALVVDCVEMRTFADSARRDLASARKAIDADRLGFTRIIRDLETRTNALFSPNIDLVESAEVILKNKILTYDNQAKERQRKAEAEARAAAAAERARIEAENTARATAERQAAEQARQAAQAAAAAGNLDHAQQLVNEAQTKEAQAAVIETTPVHVPTPIVVPEQKPKGGSYSRDNWKARVVNSEAVPRLYCTPDQKLLDGVAKRSKGNAKIEGVEFYNDESLVGR